ncbi:MAG: carboxymuconolactone decarboxylase family protein [Bacillota bacterium]
MNDNDDRADKVPGTFKEFVARFPEMGKAHEQIARAVESSGPLDRKTQELIKIGLSIGAGLESAVRSHVRRAMHEGVTEAEIEQSILLAYNTCGWPRMVMAWRWASEQLARHDTSNEERCAPSSD